MRIPLGPLSFLFGVTVIFVASIALIGWIQTHLEKRYGKNSIQSGLPVLLGVGVPVIVLFIGAIFWPGKEFVVGKPIIVASEVILVVGIAAILFTVKRLNLRLYAALEGGFALTIATQTVADLGMVIEPVQSLTLLTAAYLMIRAADNFKKDLDERMKQSRHQAALKHSPSVP